MNENISDNELMNKFSGCSMDAYKQIFNRYKNKLLNHIIWVFNIHKDNAEDIVQQTLIKVYMYKYKYKASHEFSTWVYTIAKNLSLNQMKSRKNTVSIEEENHFNYNKQETTYTMDCEDDRNNKVEILKSCISSLNVKYREILNFRYVEGLSFEEISVIQNTNINTLKTHAKRGLEILKNNLKDFDFEK